MPERTRRGRDLRPGATLAVPPGWADRVGKFVRREGLACGVVTGRKGTLRVAEAAGRRTSTPSELRVGGWIACPAARRLAAKLGIPLRSMGRLLDLLEIKIRHCDLGCF